MFGSIILKTKFEYNYRNYDVQKLMIQIHGENKDRYVCVYCVCIQSEGKKACLASCNILTMRHQQVYAHVHVQILIIKCGYTCN